MPGEALARKKKKPAPKKKRKRSGKKAPKKAVPKATETEKGAASSAEAADLDADDIPVDLDAGEAADAAVDHLIAETLAAANVDEAPGPVEPVSDLDADLAASPETEADVSLTDAEAIPNEPVEAAASFAAAHASDGPRSAEESTVGGGAEVEAAEAAIGALIDLGPVSSPEVRDRLLAAALAHAEHQEARYRVPFAQAPAAARWKALLAFVIVLVAGAVAAVPPRWALPDPPAQLGPAETARNLRLALLLQAQQVEAFRVRTQRLPASLDEVTRTLPGVRYVRSGTRAYQLIAHEADGNAIVYDSTSPAPPFGALPTVWTSASP